MIQKIGVGIALLLFFFSVSAGEFFFDVNTDFDESTTGIYPTIYDFNFCQATTDGDLTFNGELDQNNETANQVLSDNALDFWTDFETGGSTYQDLTSNGNDLSVNGNASQETIGILGGNAVTFDGAGDFLQTTDTTLFDTTGAFTLSCWVKISSVPSQTMGICGNLEYEDTFTEVEGGGGLGRLSPASKTIGNKTKTTALFSAEPITSKIAYFGSPPTPNPGGYGINYNSSSQFEGEFGVASAYTTLTASDVNAVDGNWHHVVITHDASDTVRLYVDGAQRDTGSANVLSPAGELTIGRRYEDLDANYLDGTVDEVRFFTRELSANDINALYYEGLIDPGLRAYWKFNDSNGTHTQDHSLYNNDTTLNSGVDTNGTGLFDSNSHLNTASGFFEVEDNNNLDCRKTCSAFAWVKPSTISPAGRAIFTRHGGGPGVGTRQYQLIIVNINVFGAGVGNGSDTLTVTSNATFTPGYWYHVGFTFNQGDLNLYVNGSHDISDHSDAVTDANGHNGADMVIGARNNTGAGSFPGQIEDFKIYNRVLTPAEIQADYNAWWNANYYSRVLDGFESGVEVCKDCNYSSATLNYNNNASMSGLGLFVRNCTSTSVCTNSWTQETGFTNGTNFDLNNGFGYQGRYLQFRLDQSITSGWDHANFDDTVTHVQDVNIIMVATPPTTTDDHNEGWQNFDANITLTCTDNVGGSGCDTTTYELDGGGEETYDTNILISTDANHQLDYYSTDVAGDIESTKTVLVTIDKTDPTVTITSTIDDINVGLSFVLSYEGADATSGIAKYWVSNNSETWIDNGTETSYLFTEDPETPAPFTRIYYVKSMDNADNNSTAQGISVTYTGTGSGVVSGTYCGNNSCDGSEAAITCPADCPAACGDRSCTHTESPITCPVDCAIGCGNLICEPKEDSSNCSTDCGVDTGDISIIPAGICGNNVCELNETTQSCSNDCGINSVPVIRERILNISVKKVVLVEEFKRFSKILADYGRIVEPVFMERASKIFNITSEATAQVIKTGENNEDIGSRTEFKVNIENTSNVPMDIRVMTFIEKEIAEDASKIVSETPFTIIESDPIIEFLIEALKPGETFPVTYYINKTIDESALQEIDPPIISGFEISDPGKVEQTYCARHEDCDDQSICTIEKCINGHCYFGSQSEGESCGMGAGACAGGKCVSKTLPTYQPPQAIGLTTILLLVIIALLSLWIIKEYTIKT